MNSDNDYFEYLINEININANFALTCYKKCEVNGRYNSDCGDRCVDFILKNNEEFSNTILNNHFSTTKSSEKNNK